jgi:hypothetical protein
MRFLEYFGVETMPWVIRVYILLLFAIIVVWFLSAYNVPIVQEQVMENHPLVGISNAASEAFTLIIGAILGALSLAAERTWTQERDKGNPDSEN